MKTSLLTPASLALATMLACACDFLDTGLYGHRPRADTQNRGGGSLSAPDKPETPTPRIDTTVLFAAVEFDADYDWQKDTAYRSVDYDVILYKDMEPMLRISSASSACVSPDPDTHHIIEGSLYTEYSGPDHTVLGKDGEELFRFNGRELMKGILPVGGDLYTLSQKRSGEGFTLRKNGATVLSRTDGMVFGSLCDPSYGPTGALYADGEGGYCFCYRAAGGSGDSSGARNSGNSDDSRNSVTSGNPGEEYYMVLNGTQTKIDSRQQLHDVKIWDGKPHVVTLSFSSFPLSEGRVWRETSGLTIAGRFIPYGHTAPLSGTISSSRQGIKVTTLCEAEASIYNGQSDDYAIYEDALGNVRIVSGKNRPGAVMEACHFLSPACATLAGDRLICALAPRYRDGKVRIMTGDEWEELDFNGYISRVAAEVSLAR